MRAACEGRGLLHVRYELGRHYAHLGITSGEHIRCSSTSFDVAGLHHRFEPKHEHTLCARLRAFVQPPHVERGRADRHQRRVRGRLTRSKMQHTFRFVRVADFGVSESWIEAPEMHVTCSTKDTHQ